MRFMVIEKKEFEEKINRIEAKIDRIEKNIEKILNFKTEFTLNDLIQNEMDRRRREFLEIDLPLAYERMTGLSSDNLGEAELKKGIKNHVQENW